MPEIILIILLLTIFFGNKKISELAKDAGKAGKELKNIKKEYSHASEEVQKVKNDVKENLREGGVI